jgi:hypothetical protein
MVQPAPVLSDEDIQRSNQLLADLSEVVKRYLQSYALNPENEHEGCIPDLYIKIAIAALLSLKHGLLKSMEPEPKEEPI